MPRVEVYVDGQDVLDELDDEALQAEVQRREKRKAPVGTEPTSDDMLLDQIWRHYRGEDVPQCLSEYIWRKIGKCL